MSNEVYRYIFYGGAILAAVMLLVTIILFFAYKIPSAVRFLRATKNKKLSQSTRLEDLVINIQDCFADNEIDENGTQQLIASDCTVLLNGGPDEITSFVIPDDASEVMQIEYEITYIHTDEVII